MNQLITINGVRGFIDENGVAQLNLDDVSRGLGFTQQKGKVEYIRWERVNGYLIELGFSPLVGKEYIPENVFYRLSMKSENEKGIAFQARVADEILPSIRKHGAYMTPDTIEKITTNPDFLIQLGNVLKEAQEKNKVLELKIENDKHKVHYAEAIEISEDSILVGQLAKLMRQKGVEIGEIRLFKWMRDEGYLIKSGTEYNKPTQRSMEMGLFEIKTGYRSGSGGTTKLTFTAKVTGKGQIYFINKFLPAA
ncbi:antirepressor [Paenibacillus sp. FSL H7-0357]|uniref:phage antirepressor KilAC domain-containing protein n=1 Tax=Paenibacillus sp. FSL H7-0357 TaxID=1536774 RepID=UPI0004F890CF|nr:phage antirepressor KilAC domain-containing protein [Paenibacillus sp. FSL H7-0357]AIQ19574.1 antirepressor [Paenibacillus sp. FSL H7-0357]